MRRNVNIGLWSGACVLVLALLFAFALPTILRTVLEKQLIKHLNRPAAVESVRFNPFNLCLTVQGLTIREPDDSAVFISFEQLFINAEIASALRKGPVLSEVSLEKPHIRIVRTEANRYNFSDLRASEEKQPTDDEHEPSKPFIFSIANIKIINGFVEFDDQPHNTIHRISDIEIGLPLISNFKQYVDIFVQPSFSATIDGRPFRISGQAKPFADSLETELDLDFTDLLPARYLPYMPAQLNFKMPSGRLNTKLKLRYIQRPGRFDKIRLEGSLRLADITLVGLDESPLLSIPGLDVSGITLIADERKLIIDDITVQGFNLALAREKDGTLSLQHLFNTNGDMPAEKPTEEVAADNDTHADTDQPWSVRVRNFKSEAAAITFDDLLPQQNTRFTIDALDLRLTNIATALGSPADIELACRINNETTLGLKGTIALKPLSAELELDLNDLDIRCAQSYLPESVPVALNGGILGLKGGIGFQQTDDGQGAFSLQGDASLADFAASRKGDKKNLLKCTSLSLQSIRAGNAPQTLDIKSISLEGLFVRTAIESDGTFNLAALIAAPKQTQAYPEKHDETPAPEAAPKINIDTIALTKSHIEFTDRSISPRYSTEISDIAGRITGVSNRPGAQADVHIKGKLNRYAPIFVSATFTPLQEKLTADVVVKCDTIDLSQLSPYSGKFIGRTLKKGTLSLDLTYKIQENQLTSHNKFLINQLTLGSRVDSPNATSLPVALAMSLLKNRNGEIQLDLPVSGSLDDPGFRVRNVLLQALLNILERAAVSPFTLVRALIPDGADVSTITFPCGTARLDDEAQKKLAILANLLTKKQGLRLDIQGHAAPEPDMAGLRREMMMSRMQRQKFSDMSRREREDRTPEQVVITADEFDEYLWQAYRAEKFEKPEGMLGITKRLSTEEMERLMLEHMPADDDDVRELAHQRALAAREYLSEKAGVASNRLFIIGGRVDPSGGPKNCSVQFTLK